MTKLEAQIVDRSITVTANVVEGGGTISGAIVMPGPPGPPGPPGGGGGAYFVALLSGSTDGENRDFAAPESFVDEVVYCNGLALFRDYHYTVNGLSITLIDSPTNPAPPSGSELIIRYRRQT